jgi:hypothetical protein
MGVKGLVPFTNPAGARKRLVISNDLAGDPDGLMAMAQLEREAGPIKPSP